MEFFEDAEEWMSEWQTEAANGLRQVREWDELCQSLLTENFSLVEKIADKSLNGDRILHKNKYKQNKTKMQELGALKLEMIEHLQRITLAISKRVERHRADFQKILEAKQPGITIKIEERFSRALETAVEMTSLPMSQTAVAMNDQGEQKTSRRRQTRRVRASNGGTATVADEMTTEDGTVPAVKKKRGRPLKNEKRKTEKTRCGIVQIGRPANDKSLQEPSTLAAFETGISAYELLNAEDVARLIFPHEIKSETDEQEETEPSRLSHDRNPIDLLPNKDPSMSLRPCLYPIDPNRGRSNKQRTPLAHMIKTEPIYF